jgi:hypothetical protein
MADKTPVRVVFNASNVATGLAEFQSGESVPVSNGGTGLTSIGSAGQVIKVNQAGDALVFAGEGDISIQNLVAPSNADLSLRTSGTGSIILNDLTIADNSISTNRSNDDLFINASGSGTVTLENLQVGTSGATVTTILDEDAMGSDSATSLATQQSIKAYVDTQDANVASDTLTFTNKTFDVEGTGNSISNIDVADFKAAAIITESEGIGSNDNDTTLPTSAAVKDYVDTQITAEDLDFQADSGGALSIDLDSETMTFTGGTGIDTSGSGNAVTFAIDSTVATLTGSQTLTNKVLTSPTINSPTIATPNITDATISEITTNKITSNGSNADISIQPSGTGDVLLSALRVNGTTIDSSDSTKITMAENVDVTGTLVVAGALSSSTSLALASGATVTGIADEDNMSSNSATLLVTQQSIKAYVDAQITAEDLDFQADSGGALSIDLDSETMTFTGGTGIDTSGSSNTVTFAIDSTVATLTGSQTLTNKILTSPTINSPTIATPTVTGAMTATSVTANDFTSNGSNADITVAPQGTGDINLTAGADVNIPANIGLTFGDDAEKIEGDGTDLTITGNLINLTAATAVVVPSGIPLRFVDDNEKITSNGTDLTINSGADINLTATADVNIPAGVGITFGDDAEKIEGDGTDLTITGNNIKLTATADVIIPSNVGLHFTDANEKIESDGSKLVITSGGTAFNLPTADGTDGQSLVTDGSGTLSFGTVGDPDASDDTNASALANKRITTTARAIDSFGETFQDSVLYYVCTNDHHLDTVNLQKVSLVHNDTAPFINTTGVASGTGAMTTFTTDTSNNVVRLKAASTNAVGGNVSYYKIGLGDNSTAATSGNIIVTQNTDVDSASEAITSFAHADFRGAKLFISVNNNSKTEVTNMEGLVVHDGTNAFITTYNVVNSGNNTLATFTAAISGDNVVISGAGLEPNLRITVHAIMLKDTMTANAGTYANSEAIAPVTISSSATSFDTFAQKTTNGAVYFLVSKNATEGHYAINEILVAFGSDNITHANAGFVSTKGTNQIAVTSEIKDDTEFTGDIKISSTSGASTTVSAYMIKLHAS